MIFLKAKVKELENPPSGNHNLSPVPLFNHHPPHHRFTTELPCEEGVSSRILGGQGKKKSVPGSLTD
jgi:hypothetical protein